MCIPGIIILLELESQDDRMTRMFYLKKIAGTQQTPNRPCTALRIYVLIGLVRLKKVQIKN